MAQCRRKAVQLPLLPEVYFSDFALAKELLVSLLGDLVCLRLRELIIELIETTP